MRVRKVPIPEHYSLSKRRKAQRDMAAALLYLKDPEADVHVVRSKFRCWALKDPARKGKIPSHQYATKIIKNGIKFLSTHGGLPLVKQEAQS